MTPINSQRGRRRGKSAAVFILGCNVGLFDSAESWLRTQRRKAAATVTYSRGAVSNASVKATQASTAAITDDGQVINDAAMVDWLIDRADLTLAADEVIPQPGDQIERTYGHAVERFEVVASGGGEPGWRWHGRDGQTFRVHSVRVGPVVLALTADRMSKTTDSILETADHK